MSAGAAERDGEIALSLTDIVRQQIYKQLRYAVYKLNRLRKGPDIARHARVPPGQVLEARNVVWIRQKTHIEDKIAVRRHTVPVAKARHIHHDLRLFTLSPEFLADELAQFVHRKFRRVDDQVRHGSDRSQLLS